MVTLNVCNSCNAQVHFVTGSDDIMAIIDVLMAAFPLRSFCSTMISVTKKPVTSGVCLPLPLSQLQNSPLVSIVLASKE